MNGPTKTVGPPLTPLPARKIRGVLENFLDNAGAVIDGKWLYAPFKVWSRPQRWSLRRCSSTVRSDSCLAPKLKEMLLDMLPTSKSNRR